MTPLALPRQLRSALQSHARARAPKPPTLAERIEEARQECVLAQRYFDSVSDPELVDHAVYLMEATKRRYAYLLRRSARGDV